MQRQKKTKTKTEKDKDLSETTATFVTHKNTGMQGAE